MSVIEYCSVSSNARGVRGLLRLRPSSSFQRQVRQPIVCSALFCLGNHLIVLFTSTSVLEWSIVISVSVPVCVPICMCLCVCLRAYPPPNYVANLNFCARYRWQRLYPLWLSCDSLRYALPIYGWRHIMAWNRRRDKAYTQVGSPKSAVLKLTTTGSAKSRAGSDISSNVLFNFNFTVRILLVLNLFHENSTLCVPKNVHLFMCWITLSKINDFNDFWYVKSGENLRYTVSILHICPHHLSDVATLPLEIQKKLFLTVSFLHTYFRNYVICSCQTFAVFNIPKLIKIG